MNPNTNQISLKQKFVILFREMTTCFDLRDYHQTVVTKILKTNCNAVQMKLVKWAPT